MTLYKCEKCNEKYGLDKNAKRCCTTQNSFIQDENIVVLEKLRFRHTPESKKQYHRDYYQNNKNKLCQIQKEYDSKKQKR